MNKQAEREVFFDFYKKEKEQKEKEQNKDWMYQQRERNELGADYFSYQGYHPPKKLINLTSNSVRIDRRCNAGGRFFLSNEKSNQKTTKIN